MSSLSITPDGSNEGAACPCCGNRTQTFWGYVFSDGDAHAVYYGRWAPGHTEQGLVLILSIGGWGGGDPSQRQAVGLDCRLTATGPGMMLIDAGTTPWGAKALLGRMLTRAEMLASPLASEAFAIADLILLSDDRALQFERG